MDSITKTLVMAQRTADATLADAREEADGIRKEASSEPRASWPRPRRKARR